VGNCLSQAHRSGIDWHFWPTKEPWSDKNELRPGLDAHEYNEYAWKHCKDLIDKYKPYVLWGDIDWPKAGVASGKHSVEALLDELYTANPEAVINGACVKGMHY
jgi:alpha-L-fucosidase